MSINKDIILTYSGEGDGVSFSPTYPLMFVNQLKKLGFNASIKKTPINYNYNGVPADNFYSTEYQELMKQINEIANHPITFRDLEINFHDLDVQPFVIGTTTSAGCKYKCKFCPNSKNIMFMERNKEKVLKELEFIYRYANYFEFYDNNVLLSNTFLEVLDYIPKDSRWGALINIDELTQPLLNNLLNMYRHGCRNIYIGLETFNQKDLVYFGKPYVGKVDPKEFINTLKEIGFNVFAFIIRGLPHETVTNFNSMIDYLQANDIKFGISRFFNKDGEEILETKNLSKAYLDNIRTWDEFITKRNLCSFLNKGEIKCY